MKTKTHTLRFCAVNEDIFHAIQRGIKKVETRAVTERYRDFVTGEAIQFVCGKQHFKRTIRCVKFFKTIAALAEHYSVRQIHPRCKTISELRRVYYSFHGYREKIKKYGLVAFEL